MVGGVIFEPFLWVEGGATKKRTARSHCWRCPPGTSLSLPTERIQSSLPICVRVSSFLIGPPLWQTCQRCFIPPTPQVLPQPRSRPRFLSWSSSPPPSFFYCWSVIYSGWRTCFWRRCKAGARWLLRSVGWSVNFWAWLVTGLLCSFASFPDGWQSSRSV